MVVKSKLKFILFLVLMVFSFSLYPMGQVQVFAYSHPNGLYTQTQMDAVKAKVMANSQPWKDAFDRMISWAVPFRTWQCQAVQIFDVPVYYDDPNGNEEVYSKLSEDAYAAYICAMRYKLNNETAYADEAVALLKGWATTNTAVGSGDSTLAMASAGTGFLYAAELLRGYSGWSTTDYNQFITWVTNVYKYSADDDIAHRTENRKMWGILAKLMYSCFLDDTASFTAAVNTLKSEIDTTIDADGHLPGETRREYNGLWYTYYDLAPMTAACQIVKNITGEDLFNWTSTSGKQIKKALDYYFYYIHHPDQWPYYQPMTMSEPDFNEYPVDLFEAMGGIYASKEFANYAAPYRTVLGGVNHGVGYHHSAWTFPTLMLPADYSTTLFSDDFSDGDASGWTTSAGTWTVGTDDITKMYNQTDTSITSAKAYTGDPTWTNYILSSRVKVNSFNASNPAGVGLLARFVDTSNFYQGLYYTSGNILKIEKCVGGTTTTLASKVYTFNTGKWYTFEVAVNKDLIRLYVNGVLELEANDPSLASGKIGLLAHRTNAEFDSVQVTPQSLYTDFEDGSTTDWSINTGTWSVITDGNKVYNQSSASATSATAFSGDDTWLNYALSSNIKANTLNGSPGSGAGLLARYKDANNYYSFGYYTVGNTLKIEKRVNGTYTTLASKTYTFNTGTWYALKAIVNGNNLRLYVNGALQLEANDTDFLSGKIGLNSCRANASFDNVLVTAQ